MASDESGREVKEVHFFDRHYEAGARYYERFFRRCSSSALRGEYTPMYLYDEAVPQRIHRHHRGIKLIACLRNPIARAYSQYRAGAHRWEGRDFAEALSLHPELIERGFYCKQLERYWRLFPAERILVLIYEDIAADPVAFIQRIYRFLGVDASFVPDAARHRFHRTPSVSFAYPRAEAFRQQLRRLLRSLPRREAAASLLRACGIGRLERMLQAHNVVYGDDAPPPLEAETRAALRAAFAEDIVALERRIGRDLSFWC